MFAFVLAALVAASPSPSSSPTPAPDPCDSLSAIVNRPTVTTGVCTVRNDRAEIELGFTSTVTTGTGGGVTASYPQTFARFGIAKHLEFGLVLPSYNRSSLGGAFSQGTSDIAFETKWEAGYTSRAMWGANLQVSAPTGDNGFSAGGTQYTANANWVYAMDSHYTLAGTFSFNSLIGANAAGVAQRYGTFIPSLELERSLPNASTLYAEYAYFSAAGPGLPSKSIIDAGYLRDLNAHVQVDVEYGFQPTVINGQRVQYWGFGLAYMP